VEQEWVTSLPSEQKLLCSARRLQPDPGSVVPSQGLLPAAAPGSPCGAAALALPPAGTGCLGPATKPQPRRNVLSAGKSCGTSG